MSVDDEEQLHAVGVRERLADRGDRRVRNGNLRRRAIGFRDAEHAMQLARIEHRLHDVGTADELAIDVELRDRRPVAVVLDALADLVVGEHVDGRVVVEQRVEPVDRGRREAALRPAARAFHEEHDAVRGEQLVDTVTRGGGEGHETGPAAGRA